MINDEPDQDQSYKYHATKWERYSVTVCVAFRNNTPMGSIEFNSHESQYVERFIKCIESFNEPSDLTDRPTVITGAKT